MAKRLVVLVFFLAIPVSILMIGPVSPAPGDSSEVDAASIHEVSGRESSWLVAPAAVTTATLEKGRFIFLRDCARCHGPRGDGVSSIARTLHPSPFDLTSFDLADSFILRVVRDGVPGSDMPGWSLGLEEDVRAVSAYTARLARPVELSPQERYASPEALQDAGRRVYTTHCTSCHGEQGNGDGPDAARHLPAPASFADMRPSYVAAKRVIENGLHGTAMPSWPLLTSPEIQAVTFYVRTLYTNTGGPTGPRP